MYKIAKKFSILIIIAYISFELLSRISVYHISSYIILFVFFYMHWHIGKTLGATVKKLEFMFWQY